MSVFNVPVDLVRCVVFPFLTYRDLAKLSAVCSRWRWYIVEEYARAVAEKIGCGQLVEDSALSVLELLHLWRSGQALACGTSHGAMIRSDGSVSVWYESTLRSQLVLPRTKARSVSCGDGHTVIVTMDDTVFVSGKNSHGQLGLGDRVDRAQLTPLPTPEKIVMAEAGANYTIFLSKNQNRLFWAGELNVTNNPDGRLALNLTEVPFKFRMPGERIVQITAGHHHFLALTDQDRLLSAGSGERKRLGRPLTEEEPAHELHPVVFANRPSNVSIVQMDAGSTHSLVLFANGSVFTFGQSQSGELGLPSYNDSVIAQVIPNLPKAIGVAAGNHHSLILAAERNKIVAFGFGALGQLGYRSSFWSSTFPQQSPLPENGEDKRIKFISAGDGFSACLSGDAALFTCGRSSLCAGAGPGVKNGTVLTVFSRAPDIE